MLQFLRKNHNEQNTQAMKTLGAQHAEIIFNMAKTIRFTQAFIASLEDRAYSKEELFAALEIFCKEGDYECI